MSRRRAAPDDPLAVFHPAVAAWFRSAFPGGPTEAQRLAWPRIAARDNVLLVSPTGTGKTLAAFLVALDAVVKRRLAGEKGPRLSTLYISPLKALDEDVHRNLDAPRAGIRRELPEIVIESAVRTGDTTTSQRASQIRKPPDVLITTPESLYLMLTTGARRILASVDTVIVDEVHSVADTKRGSHLTLSLERLEDAVVAAGGAPPQRIALSATVSPAERVAEFIGGAHPVVPIVVNARKDLELAVHSPSAVFGKDAEESMWGPTVELVAAEVARRKTTIVFCNNRRHAERVAARLEERIGVTVPAHHGSVAKQQRKEIEADLKAGAYRVLVATGSLELGIDVGDVDAVVQVSSPKGIARALQRVGRSGHVVGETSRGTFVPLYLDDLFECAAVVEGMNERDVEETRPPEIPLDVLAQQLVAETVARADDGLTAASLYATFRRAAPYRRLSKRLFDETLAMLSGKYPKERFAELAPKLVWDRATDRVAPLPAARLSAILDGGTIADRGAYKAVLGNGKTVVGELDEEFVYELRVGEAFLLGSRAWRAVEISHDKVVVEDATGSPAKLPFWKGEGLGRTVRLGARVGRFKRFVAERLDDPSLHTLLESRFGCDEKAADAIVNEVRREAGEPGGVASDRRIVFETFPNELGDPCLVVRSVFGRGVNLPWSLALASVMREEIGVEVEAIASDDGILLRAPSAERELPLARLAALEADDARERLLAELPNTAMFGARFRENAQRALLLPRARSGRRTPFWLQRLRAKDLLATTRTLPDFPIVAETYRDCLRDLWSTDELLRILKDLASGRLEKTTEARKSPSPGAQSLLFSFVIAYMYEWDAPKAEKGIHALAANRELLGEVLGDEMPDAIRPEAVEEARADASRLSVNRRARTADELLLFFQELGDLTREEAEARVVEDADGAAWIDELLARGSLARATIGGEERLIAAEDRGAPLDRVLLRFVSTRGPVTAAALAHRFGIEEAAADDALERFRTDGLVVRGRFGTEDGAQLFAGARLADSIRRRTLGILRREIRPVPLDTWRAFLVRRQGVEPGARFSGPHASESAIALLRGLPLPVLAWEPAILPARLAAPDPEALDALSARGLLVWRLSGVKDPRAARLSFFFRGEGGLFLAEALPDLDALSASARSLYERLATSGASFLSDLGREEDLIEPLLELALAGLVTGDGLRGLRELLKGGEKKKPRSGTPRVRPHAQHPGREALRAAEARVAARLGIGRAPERTGVRSGRFSLLDTPGVAGDTRTRAERADVAARLLLARWGVVRRELLELEDSSALRWSDVAPVFARLELRGDVRRGEFVEGGGPIQYADEETVEELRRLRDTPTRDDAGPPAVVSGADPVILATGVALDRDGLAALASGRVLATLTGAGALALAPELPDRSLRAALTAMQELKRRGRDPLDRPRRLVVTSVDGAPAVGSFAAPLLESLGFSRDRDGYVWRAL